MIKKIFFLANPNSIHVMRWLDICKSGEIIVDTSLCPENIENSSIAGYILLGIKVMFARTSGVLHAHSASGYGLTALISLKKYIITIYGTEVYSVKKSGFLYRFFISLVLKRARVITASSEEMSSFVQTTFNISSEKIRVFTLGYFEKIFFDQKRPGRRYHWVVNRRTHPVYNTIELLRGFYQYCAEGGQGDILVAFGNSDGVYANKVYEEYSDSPFRARVRLIKEGVSMEEMADFLNDSKLAISTPESDQLSASILESIACGCVPVLYDNGAYDSIFLTDCAYKMIDRNVEDFCGMFHATSLISQSDLDSMSDRGKQYLAATQSQDAINNMVKQLYADAC